MSELDLCANPRCRDYGQHLDSVCRDGCRGCLPRPVTIGLLCRTCADGIGRDARAAAVLHAALAMDLVAAGGGGGGSSGNPFPTMSFDPVVAEVRATIAHTLTSWVKLIHEEAGYELPELGWRILPLPAGIHGPARRLQIVDSGLDYLAAWLDLHRAWIAAHGTAGEACDELSSLVHTGRRQQDHIRPAVVDIGPCPLCAGQLRAIVRRDEPTPTEVICDSEQPHRWAGEAQIAALGREVGARDGWLSARDVSRRYGRPLGTVRRWASEQRWRKTEDGKNPVLYHPADVEATAGPLAKVAA